MDLTGFDSYLNADPVLVHRGRWVNQTFTLGTGDTDYLYTSEQGKITNISRIQSSGSH